MNLKKIRADLSFLRDFEVVLYGSYVSGGWRDGSDIDIAVISRSRVEHENIELLTSFLGMAKPIYEIRVFELLPLKVKATLMSDYDVIFGSEPEVSEYFYFYRKLWDDQKHRILEGYHSSYRDKIRAMRSRT